jgi:Flp pilus assembly CpaF family ATPase
VERRLSGELEVLGRPLDDDDKLLLGRSLAAEALREERAGRLARGEVLLSEDEEDRLSAEVVAEVFPEIGLDRLLVDPVTDLDCNGSEVVYLTYADGSRERQPPLFADDTEMSRAIRLLARRAGVPADGPAVEVDASLPDGSRLTAVLGPAAPWPVLSVRRHRFGTLTLEDLVAGGMLDRELAEVLVGMGVARCNVLVSGGTSTGKTSLLRALLQRCCASWERLVTVEDTYELGLHRDPIGHPDVVPLLARRANLEGAGEITMAQLTRLALRLNPSRVLVGEVRGAEAVGMLDAMTLGNDGSAGTIHARSSREALARLGSYVVRSPEELRVEEAMLLISSAVDVVVHLGWSAGLARRRVVASVREVTGLLEAAVPATNELWAPGPDGRATRTTVPASARLLADLTGAGVDPAVLAPSGGMR